jgi:cell division protein FtsN
VIPDAELLPPSQKQEGSPTVSEPVQVKDPRQYVLQAGSFRQSQDAETLRARIALLGVEATIQPVTLNQGERWHRVRIGPLSTLDELNRVRRRLDENGIGVLLVRQS